MHFQIRKKEGKSWEDDKFTNIVILLTLKSMAIICIINYFIKKKLICFEKREKKKK